MGITPPQVPPRARNPDGNMHLRIQPNEVTAAYPLTDHHVGTIGQHRSIPTRDVADAKARLLVRPSMFGEAQEISRDRWQFARYEVGTAVSDPEWVRLDGGFQPGLVYDLIYVPRDCPVVGAGLIAMRDLAAFLRRHPASPLSGKVDHVIGEGISQCGRLMRTFLGLGLNTAEDGGLSYDGLLIHVAGGRRGEFNMRYGQPSCSPLRPSGTSSPSPTTRLTIRPAVGRLGCSTCNVRQATCPRSSKPIPRRNTGGATRRSRTLRRTLVAISNCRARFGAISTARPSIRRAHCPSPN